MPINCNPIIQLPITVLIFQLILGNTTACVRSIPKNTTFASINIFRVRYQQNRLSFIRCLIKVSRLPSPQSLHYQSFNGASIVFGRHLEQLVNTHTHRHTQTHTQTHTHTHTNICAQTQTDTERQTDRQKHLISHQTTA